MCSAAPVDRARLESRLDHGHARAHNRGDIEAHLDVASGSKLGEPYRCQSTKAPLLPPVDSTFRTTELTGRSRLDFAEYDHVFVNDTGSTHDKVDLAGLAAPVASDQRIAVLCVPAQRFVFAEPTTRLRGQ